MASQMPGVHGPGCTRCNQLLLAFDGAQALGHDEGRPDLSSPLNDSNEVGMHAL